LSDRGQWAIGRGTQEDHIVRPLGHKTIGFGIGLLSNIIFQHFSACYQLALIPTQLFEAVILLSPELLGRNRPAINPQAQATHTEHTEPTDPLQFEQSL
jgi:hypothetical protein